MIYSLSSLIDTRTTLAVLVVAVIWIVIYDISGISNKDDRPTPPLSLAGTMKSINLISGPNAPWFFLDISKIVGSNVYTLCVYIPGGIRGGTHKNCSQLIIVRTFFNPVFFETVTSGSPLTLKLVSNLQKGVPSPPDSHLYPPSAKTSTPFFTSTPLKRLPNSVSKAGFFFVSASGSPHLHADT